MDDRKRKIGELEKHRREQIALLDVLLTRLGEAVFERTGNYSQDDFTEFEELAVYRRLKNDIAGSEASIQDVEEQLRRFREIEETIETKEREENACAKELAVVHGSLGKELLNAAEDGEFAWDFCAPYREQADALNTKVLSLEDRLEELDSKERSNVFTWIGKSAQGLVVRSFLTKARDNLEQLYRTIGERYARGDPGTLIAGDVSGDDASSGIKDLCAKIEQMRAGYRDLSQELADLKEEKRKISGTFSAEGSPQKHIQNLRSHIAHARDELRNLHRRIGGEAACIEGECRHCVGALVAVEDQKTLDNAGSINRLIHEDQTEIEKLKASLAIDEEKARIEKYRRMIQDKKDKIAQAEKNMAEYERGIRDSEETINKLQNLEKTWQQN